MTCHWMLTLTLFAVVAFLFPTTYIFLWAYSGLMLFEDRLYGDHYSFSNSPCRFAAGDRRYVNMLSDR